MAIQGERSVGFVTEMEDWLKVGEREYLDSALACRQEDPVATMVES